MSISARKMPKLKYVKLNDVAIATFFHDTCVMIQYYYDLKYIAIFSDILPFITFFQLQMMSPKENFGNIKKFRLSYCCSEKWD